MAKNREDAGSRSQSAIELAERVNAAFRPHRELIEQATSWIEPWTRIVEQAASALKPYCDAIEQLNAPLKQFGGILAQLNELIRPAIDLGWVQSLAEGFSRFEQALANAESMGRAGWTIPLNASLPDCVRLLRAATSPEAADTAFVEFYVESDNASQALLLADLHQQPKLEDFRELLQEAVFALHHQKYLLVVTAMLPVLEGVARRCWNDGVWRGHSRERFFNEKLSSLETDSFDHVAWTATRAFVDGLYAHNDDSDPKPEMLNRHWILHGRGPADGNLADCLRLLQAIHTVLSLAEDEQPGATKV